MRNNKQDLLTQIRIVMSILKYTDEDLIRLFGKDYKQISIMTYDKIKEIVSTLNGIYRNNQNSTKEV
ncbi:hypothetical protein [uncultured Clostridium sp.]|uniref:hypothetical protein n=1 Tax=uncultured Clostridium sp. TaxID=59620 RepID=UPI0026ED3F2C|nr:hypothetical protein [uncultured Clostridium sp.]